MNAVEDPNGPRSASAQPATNSANEHNLSGHERELRLASAQLPAHAWITDSDLRVNFILGNALSGLGINTDHYVGRSLNDPTVVRDGGDIVIDAHQRALAGQRVGYETSISGRDFDACVEPLKDEQGQIIGCVGVAVDITERKQSERRLALQYAVSHALAEASGVGDVAENILRAVGNELSWDYGALWTIDDETNALRCSTTWTAQPNDFREFVEVSRQTSFARGEGLVGTAWARSGPLWVVDIDVDPPFTRLQVAAREGLRAGFALPIVVSDQLVCVFEYLSREARNPDQVVLALTTALGQQIGQFIERKTLEKQLANEQLEADRVAALSLLRREFVSAVSHDLSTPLTAAKAGLGLLGASAGDRLSLQEQALLHNVLRNVQHLDTLIDGLLTYNQLETGTLELVPEPVDLRMIVLESIGMVDTLIQQKHQQLDIDLPDTLLAVGDPVRLQQVVVNLLANAHKHTPSGTKIIVSGHACTGQIMLTVRDTGPGIPDSTLDTLLSGTAGTLGTNGRSGLGLQIVQRLVTLHRGAINLESQLGAGLKVVISLPVGGVGSTEH